MILVLADNDGSYEIVQENEYLDREHIVVFDVHKQRFIIEQKSIVIASEIVDVDVLTDSFYEVVCYKVPEKSVDELQTLKTEYLIEVITFVKPHTIAYSFYIKDNKLDVGLYDGINLRFVGYDIDLDLE